MIKFLASTSSLREISISTSIKFKIFYAFAVNVQLDCLTKAEKEENVKSNKTRIMQSKHFFSISIAAAGLVIDLLAFL